MQSQGSENRFILKWGTPGTGNGQFHDPADLTIDSANGFVYVADLLNNRIQKPILKASISHNGVLTVLEMVNLVHPGDVAVSPWGEVFVADIDNARIEKFDSNATFISKWGIFVILIDRTVQSPGRYWIRILLIIYHCGGYGQQSDSKVRFKR